MRLNPGLVNPTKMEKMLNPGLKRVWKGSFKLICLFVLLMAGLRAHASVAFLMEEPYGEFGAMNPTGHAAVYLNHICAASPTELRMCRSGELGVVIKIGRASCRERG